MKAFKNCTAVHVDYLADSITVSSKSSLASCLAIFSKIVGSSVTGKTTPGCDDSPFLHPNSEQISEYRGEQTSSS
uniref:Uncharacterized protein n=1 Tax=Romanomermis culicivorax TaxID=13658 RepID=A0A915L0N9_ROMCU